MKPEVVVRKSPFYKRSMPKRRGLITPDEARAIIPDDIMGASAVLTIQSDPESCDNYRGDPTRNIRGHWMSPGLNENDAHYDKVVNMTSGEILSYDYSMWGDIMLGWQGQTSSYTAYSLQDLFSEQWIDLRPAFESGCSEYSNSRNLHWTDPLTYSESGQFWAYYWAYCPRWYEPSLQRYMAIIQLVWMEDVNITNNARPYPVDWNCSTCTWISQYGADTNIPGIHLYLPFSPGIPSWFAQNIQGRTNWNTFYQRWISHPCLLFPQINLAQGEAIDVSAIKFFRWPDSTTVDVTSHIYCSAEDNAQAMLGLGNGTDPVPYHLRPRTYRRVRWEQTFTGNNEYILSYETPDLSCIIQEVVDRPGWREYNNLLFFFEPVENTNQYNAVWFIDNWDDDSLSAHLSMTSGYTEAVGGGIQLGGSPFKSETMRGGIKLGGSVFKNEAMSGGIKISPKALAINFASRIPFGGIKLNGSAVESYIHFSKTYNIAMSGGVLFTGTSKNYETVLVGGGLRVGGDPYGYSCNAARGTNTKIGTQVIRGATSTTGDGTWDTIAMYYSSLRLDAYKTQKSNMYIRFNNVDVRPGNQINYAYVQFNRQYASGNPQAAIRAEDTGHSANNPATQGDVTNRPRSKQGVLWDLSDTTLGTIETPNIACVIQEIVDKPTWDRNNSIMLFFDNLYEGPNLINPSIHEFTDTGVVETLTSPRLVIYYYGSSDIEGGGGTKMGGSATVKSTSIRLASGGIVVGRKDDGYLDVPHTAAHLLRDATISFWMRTAKIDPQAVISGAHDNRDNEMTVIIEDNKIQFDNHRRET